MPTCSSVCLHYHLCPDRPNCAASIHRSRCCSSWTRRWRCVHFQFVQRIENEAERRSLLVGLLVQLRLDGAIRTNNQDDRPRHAVAFVARRILRITKAVAIDDLRFWIRKERIGNRALGGECRQRTWRIIRQARETITALLDFDDTGLQLDQLRLTVGSPNGGSEKEEYNALVAHQGGHISWLA